MGKLEILYMQEFDGTCQNPGCTDGKKYKDACFKMFPKLRALDGYRKAAGDVVYMKDALPGEENQDFSYNVDSIQWFDPIALDNPNPAKELFEDSIAVRREENEFTALMNDCKSMLTKKTDITKL